MNEPAFLEFYARTAGRLNGYLRKLTGNVAIAEDLLQEAYMRFLSRTRLPDDDEYQKNYLFRIATNLARDHFRRERRQQVAAPQFASEVSLEAARATTAMFQVDPFDRADVWSALATLSSRDRELLLLAYVEGMTHKEIGQITGLMRASIKPLLFRARKRFASALMSMGVAPTASAETRS